MIQPISNINHPIERAAHDIQSFSDDLLLIVTNFLTSQNLGSLPRVNKQFRKIVQKFYKHTDSLRKLISVSSHILGNPSIYRPGYLTNNDQFIVYIANSSLKLLDVVQGKTYSYQFSTNWEAALLNSKILHMFHNQLVCISQSETKVHYVALKENINLTEDYSFNFPERRPSHCSLYSSVDPSGRFAMIAGENQYLDGFIDIINIENQTISTIEDQEVRQFRPSYITIHQDSVYIAYMNWNAPNRGSYANHCDLIKAYSLTSKEVLRSYASSFPKKILVGNHHLVVSKDNVYIQIFNKQDGTLIHTIDPAIDKDDTRECGYICSLSLYEDKIVAGLKDNRIKIWSIQTGKLLKTIDLNLIDANLSLNGIIVWKLSLQAEGWDMSKLTINNHYLAIIKNSSLYDIPKRGKNKIFIFDMRNYRPIHAFEAINTISSLKFNKDQLIATLNNGQVQAWDSRLKNERKNDVPNQQSSVSTERPAEILPPVNISPSLASERQSSPISSQINNNARTRNATTRRFSALFIQKWYKGLIAIINTIVNLPFRFAHWLRQLIRR